MDGKADGGHPAPIVRVIVAYTERCLQNLLHRELRSEQRTAAPSGFTCSTEKATEQPRGFQITCYVLIGKHSMALMVLGSSSTLLGNVRITKCKCPYYVIYTEWLSHKAEDVSGV